MPNGSPFSVDEPDLAQIHKFIWAKARNQYAFKIIDPAVESDVDDCVGRKRVWLLPGIGSLALSCGVF